MSYADMVESHEKSVTLGGSLSLFPVQPGLPQAYARNIRMAIKRAEDAAYERGRRDAQALFRSAIGLPK